MLFAQTLLGKEREKVTYVSEYRSRWRHYRLPVVIYFEDGEYIAECPLFYVSSHGDTRNEALQRVKEALELYLIENKDSIKPSEMEFTEEEVIKKSQGSIFRV